jgi:hypothetical protein
LDSRFSTRTTARPSGTGVSSKLTACWC